MRLVIRRAGVRHKTAYGKSVGRYTLAGRQRYVSPKSPFCCERSFSPPHRSEIGAIVAVYKGRVFWRFLARSSAKRCPLPSRLSGGELTRCAHFLFFLV